MTEARVRVGGRGRAKGHGPCDPGLAGSGDDTPTDPIDLAQSVASSVNPFDFDFLHKSHSLHRGGRCERLRISESCRADPDPWRGLR